MDFNGASSGNINPTDMPRPRSFQMSSSSPIVFYLRRLVLDHREEVPGVDRDELSGVIRGPVSPQRTEERSNVLSPQGPDGMSRD